MLIEVTKRNLSTSDLTLGIELLNDLNDKQNSEILVKYLSDSKVIKLPDVFQRKLDHGLLMISRMKTQSQLNNENNISEEQDDIKCEISSDSDHQSLSAKFQETENYIPVEMSKDAIKSSRKITNFLTQKNPSKRESPVKLYTNKHNQDSRLERIEFNIEDSKSEYESVESPEQRRTIKLAKSPIK